ncbi:MAG: tetratricopeptide repeat protein [Pyrinomonadaceae bacterium]|nr:tetratricopeptide repeat protein [Pyrinomonadaceae bacterium]
MKKNLLPFCAALLIAGSTIFAQSSAPANKKAVEAMTNGRFADAIAILDKDIRDEKNLFASYLLRADIKRMTGDFPGSFADLNSAIEIKPEDGSLYERRAELTMITRRDMKAMLADLDRAITYGIKHERIFVQRGSARASTGDLDGAISDYQNAVGMRPNYAAAYIGLAGTYRQRGDDEAAVKVLEEFISGIENSSSTPKQVEGKATVTTNVDLPAVSGSDLKRGQQTVIMVTQTAADGPPSPDQMRAMTERMEQSKNTALAYITLADLLIKRSDLQRAMELVGKGIALDSTDFYGLDVRGRIKIKNGDLNGGIADLTRAITAFPPNPGPYLDRGIAYLMLGKDGEAQQDFDRYLEIAPRGKELLEKRIAQAKAEKQ